MLVKSFATELWLTGDPVEMLAFEQEFYCFFEGCAIPRAAIKRYVADFEMFAQLNHENMNIAK